jgi:short-chain fatty acids transporter
MLRTIARPTIRIVERWMPDSLVFAIILSAIVALMSLGLTDSGPVDVVRGWGDGLSGLLEFIAQISIVLALGYTLAHTPPVQRFLSRISRLPRSAAVAYGFVALIAALASLISWGLGLIVGGVMAVEVASSARERGIRLHYPLLVASAYSGYVVWHMGYSGSGPLAAATPGGFYEDLAPLVPVTETIFAWWNLAAIAVAIAAVVVSMMLLAPRGDDPIVEFTADEHAGEDTRGSTGGEADPQYAGDSPELAEGEEVAARNGAPAPAERLDGARVLTLIMGAALVAYLIVYFAQEGLDLTLNIVNWSFLAAIFLLVHSPQQLVGLIADAGKTVGQILLQYPLYAGILGMMTTTGLVEVLSSFFVNISGPQTLGVVTMIFAGLINMFIPSGGGQFAVQAPIFISAADQLEVSHSVVIMAIAYGDQWTNMIQPFWTIPVLAVAGLRVRDIMGYTTVTLLVTGVVFLGVLLLLGQG